MQSRPHSSGLSFPPTPPHIPTQAIQSLIPRLTTTINDIDQFKNLLASGANDGTLPNWDSLLQRYSLLLGRVNALSTYLSQPLPTPTASVSTPSSQVPALSRYLVHPLNPLPAEGISPLAPDTFFQALNTQQLPAVSASNQTRENGMEGVQMDLLQARLRDRLRRESTIAKAVGKEIERREEEVDWTMRINDEEDDQEKEAKSADEEDEDLFGDDEDEEGVAKVKETTTQKEALPNRRPGWQLSDYLQFMESGKEPVVIGV
ncbi:hypothetical protein P7C73_g858, partial [Tremellales sp. Uapishka_1]